MAIREASPHGHYAMLPAGGDRRAPWAARETVPPEPPKPRLLDLVRQAIRTRHYSRRTEKAYVHWIKRYIFFHGKRHPAEMGAAEVGAFLTSLAVQGKVAASTQNQALSALLFLYREVLGVVASLARPGGNVTGLSMSAPDIGGKRLELLKEVVPTLSRVAFLWNPDVRGAVLDYNQTEGAARSLGLLLQSVEAARTEDLDRAFSAITEQRAQALIVASPNPVTLTNRRRIASFAQSHRLPSMYANRDHVDAGGLMAYGPSVADLYRRAATFVDKILEGTKPADLPVEQPTKFVLVISVKTAKALGLTIPQSMLLRADQVIQ